MMNVAEKFEKLIPKLVTLFRIIAEETRRGGNRPWMDFFEDGTQVGKFDFAGIHKLFERMDANNEYQADGIKDDTELKDMQTLKLSADFLAGMERDYRMRTRSRIRMFVHAGVLLPAANGTDAGALRQNTTYWMNNIQAETAENP
jgi:hypothetical protein